MNFELSGKLLDKGTVQSISDTFKKREFVVQHSETISNGTEITNFVKFQIIQARVDLVDSFQEGDEIKVNFNIRGNKWEKDGKVSYFTNLEAWKIERVGNSSSNHSSADLPNVNFSNIAASDSKDDLPF